MHVVSGNPGIPKYIIKPPDALLQTKYNTLKVQTLGALRMRDTAD